MKQKRRQKMWQEFKVLILASVGLKRHKKGSKEIKRYDGYKIYIVLLITYLRISKKKWPNTKFSRIILYPFF